MKSRSLSGSPPSTSAKPSQGIPGGLRVRGQEDRQEHHRPRPPLLGPSPGPGRGQRRQDRHLPRRADRRIARRRGKQKAIVAVSRSILSGTCCPTLRSQRRQPPRSPPASTTGTRSIPPTRDPTDTSRSRAGRRAWRASPAHPPLPTTPARSRRARGARKRMTTDGRGAPSWSSRTQIPIVATQQSGDADRSDAAARGRPICPAGHRGTVAPLSGPSPLSGDTTRDTPKSFCCALMWRVSCSGWLLGRRERPAGWPGCSARPCRGAFVIPFRLWRSGNGCPSALAGGDCFGQRYRRLAMG
jgi:hypothetical protein